jgi:hypothetical protein
MTDDLPLAAHAVLNAAMVYSEPAFEPLVRKMIAASIRAAVDQVLPLDDDPEFFPGNCCERVLKQEQQETRDALLAIAASIESLPE